MWSPCPSWVASRGVTFPACTHSSTCRQIHNTTVSRTARSLSLDCVCPRSRRLTRWSVPVLVASCHAWWGVTSYAWRSKLSWFPSRYSLQSLHYFITTLDGHFPALSYPPELQTCSSVVHHGWKTCHQSGSKTFGSATHTTTRCSGRSSCRIPC